MRKKKRKKKKKKKKKKNRNLLRDIHLVGEQDRLPNASATAIPKFSW